MEAARAQGTALPGAHLRALRRAPGAAGAEPGLAHLALTHREHGCHQLGEAERGGEGWSLLAQSQDQEIQELRGQHLLEKSQEQAGQWVFAPALLEASRKPVGQGGPLTCRPSTACSTGRSFSDKGTSKTWLEGQ